MFLIFLPNQTIASPHQTILQRLWKFRWLECRFTNLCCYICGPTTVKVIWGLQDLWYLCVSVVMKLPMRNRRRGVCSKGPYPFYPLCVWLLLNLVWWLRTFESSARVDLFDLRIWIVLRDSHHRTSSPGRKFMIACLCHCSVSVALCSHQSQFWQPEDLRLLMN
jgi:hypothetical protein